MYICGESEACWWSKCRFQQCTTEMQDVMKCRSASACGPSFSQTPPCSSSLLSPKPSWISLIQHLARFEQSQAAEPHGCSCSLLALHRGVGRPAGTAEFTPQSTQHIAVVPCPPAADRPYAAALHHVSVGVDAIPLHSSAQCSRCFRCDTHATFSLKPLQEFSSDVLSWLCRTHAAQRPCEDQLLL